MRYLTEIFPQRKKKKILKMSIKSDIFLRCEINDCKIDVQTKKIYRGT